ncbi:MAG: PAS domain-containing protein [Methanoregula sp.]|nr:PAS domain-containing protein [Methanoregula sp.]
MTISRAFPAPQKGWLPFLVLPVLTLAIFIISIISLFEGWLTIFQNLFYFPIIIACVYYGKKGFLFSVLLALSYFILMALFSNDPVVLQGALIRILFFILVAGVITYLTMIRIKTEEALRESEERFRLTRDAINDGIWDWNIPTGTALFTPHWYTMLGYESDELPASYPTWRSLIHPDDITAAEEKIQRHLDGKEEGYSVEFRMRTKKGDWKWILSRGKVVERDAGGKPLRAVGIHTDISGLKLAENALVRVNQKLNVITQLTRQDLTTQIFILNSYCALTKNYAEGQDKIIDVIQKSEQAVRSINEIAEFTRDYEDMGAKPPKWQNVKMTFLFGLSHITIGDIQHRIETEDLEIFADPLFEKACQGLIENSLYHGERVRGIRISHETTDNGTVIIFEDDGVGIPTERKEQIFSRGEGGHTPVRSLNFIRDILDITGITIHETGEDGKGVRFEIAVPKDRARFNKV